MPTNIVSIAAHGLYGCFSLLETLLLNLDHKSSSRTATSPDNAPPSAAILRPLLIISAGALLSNAPLVTGGGKFNSAIKAMLAAVSPAARTSGDEGGLGGQFSRFAFAVANTPALFDLLAMLAVLAAAFYIAHSHFVRYMTEKDVQDSHKAEAAAEDKADKDTAAAAAAADPAPEGRPKPLPPPKKASKSNSSSFTSLTSPAAAACVVLVGVGLRGIDSCTPVQLFALFGRVVTLFGYHSLHHSIASSHAVKGGGTALAAFAVHLHVLATASLLNSMVVERGTYELTSLYHFFLRTPRDSNDRVEMHAALATLFGLCITVYHSSRIFFSRGSSSKRPSPRAFVLPLLLLLLVLLLGPFGCGWVVLVGPHVQVVLAYSFFAYAVFFAASVAATGAPGIIVMAGGLQLLCSYHKVDFEKLVAEAAKKQTPF